MNFTCKMKMFRTFTITSIFLKQLLIKWQVFIQNFKIQSKSICEQTTAIFLVKISKTTTMRQNMGCKIRQLN